MIDEKYELIIPEKIYIIKDLEEAKELIKRYKLSGFTLRLIKDDYSPIIRNPTEPATERQLKFLSDLGVEGTNFTKEEAKQLIKDTLKERDSHQTKQTFQKESGDELSEELKRSGGSTEANTGDNFPDY